jgi:hypothetical protein
LLDRYLTWTIGHVRPAISQVAQTLPLTAVVSPHVSPDPVSGVMPEPAVQLHVQTTFLDQDVEMLSAIYVAFGLPCSLGQPMASAKLRITELQDRLRASPEIGQRLKNDSTPSCLLATLQRHPQPVWRGRAPPHRVSDEAECGMGSELVGQQVENGAFGVGTTRFEDWVRIGGAQSAGPMDHESRLRRDVAFVRHRHVDLPRLPTQSREVAGGLMTQH